MSPWKCSQIDGINQQIKLLLHFRLINGTMNVLVGQLVARQPQVALWRLPMNGSIGQAARWQQDALPMRLPMDQ